MKLIYTDENPILVRNAKNIMEQKGIKVVLKNEFISGGIGEASPLDTWLELWVAHDEDFDKAKAIVDKGLTPPGAEQWVCSQCNESNDPSFEICWNCKTERPS